jgi:ryanodine receptor 2
LYIIAAVLLVSGVFALARDGLNYIRYGILFRKDIYYFSELNKNSLHLALSIIDKKKKVKIIFCNVQKDNILKNQYEKQLKQIHALMFSKSITAIPFENKGKCTKTIFLIKNIEEYNLNDTLSLVTLYRNIKLPLKLNIHVFSNLKNSVEFLDAISAEDKRNFNIRLFHEANENAMQLLLKHPLYLAPKVRELKKMNVMIVGLGTVGMEILKSILWCGQMLNYSLEIYAFDLFAEEKKKEFESDCPGFYDTGNSIIKSIEDILHFYAIDVNSSDFDRKLKELSQVNYIVVCLDSDEKTIDISAKIRKLFIRNYVLDKNDSNLTVLQPDIFPMVRDEEKYIIVDELSKEYHLYPFGKITDIYNYDNVMDGLLENMSIFVQYAYQKSTNQSLKLEDCSYSREIDRRSDRAFALHAFYKIWDLGYKININKELFTQLNSIPAEANLAELLENNEKYKSILKELEEKNYINWFDNMVYIEKRRWNIFKLCEGWIGFPFEKVDAYHEELKFLNKTPHGTKKIYQLKIAKINASIINLSELNSKEEVLKNYFLNYDKCLTEWMLKIIISISDITKGDDGILYTPRPVNTSNVELSQDLTDLCEELATNTHDLWAQSRIKDGWTFGPERNDALKKHPCLIPYESLPESEKLYDRQTAMETLKLITKLGYKITK